MPELIFVYGMSPILLFFVGYPVFLAPFVEETILFTLCILGTLSKINWLYVCEFMSGLYSVSLVYIAVFTLVP